MEWLGPGEHSAQPFRPSGSGTGAVVHWARSPMTSSRFSLSLVGVVGVFVAVLSAAALWLAIADPVSTATAVDAATQGDVSPMIKALSGVLYEALRGILKYL